MSKLATLKAATSLSDLAKLLGFMPKAVSYILYKQASEAKYCTFQIPKRNGGNRTIEAPIKPLKLLQQRLSDLLQDCIDEISVAKQRIDQAAHGFKRNRSIITNAQEHRHRRWVFNLDLEDFFPSINFGRVRGFLLKDRDFELQEAVATVIAQIACNENSLPQGSPCSPVISNLIAHLLDMRLVKLARKAGCTYSRYADDLTFSTNKREIPPDICVPSNTGSVGPHLWFPGEALRRAIEGTGFRINATKTHLMYRSSRQNVTGLIVNEKINVRSEYRRNVRAMVDSLVNTGTYEFRGVKHEDGKAVLEKRPGTLDELHGMLGFIENVDSYNEAKTPPNQRSLKQGEKKSSRRKVYRKFLIYSTFYATPKPVVICEGETDNIYLTHAIRQLAAEYPALAEVKEDKKVLLKVRLYKYPRTSTARLLDLNDGGSGVLNKFIASYKKETKHFTGPGLAAPIVVLYDNDSGAKTIRSAIKAASGVEPKDEPFVHVYKNLYAVPTPLGTRLESEIEDFFDDLIKETVIGGKTFKEGGDIEKHYGKKIFAHKVVRPNAETLDFTGFRPLLTNLAAAIEAHNALKAPAPMPDLKPS